MTRTSLELQRSKLFALILLLKINVSLVNTVMMCIFCYTVCMYQVVFGTVYDHETFHTHVVHHCNYHGNITCLLPIATSFI